VKNTVAVCRRLTRYVNHRSAARPLVENAIKHGISECLAGGEVRISARVMDDAIVVSVVDTGVGVTEATIERRKARGSMGLSNIEQRLQRYSNLATSLILHITPGEGTRVEVRIPLQASETSPLARATKSS
jgi:two-component system, sensor histidine kinase YesM